MTHGWYQWGGGKRVGFICVCVWDRMWACSCVVRVYGSCEKAQERAADLANNESGALPSERVSVRGGVAQKQNGTEINLCMKGANGHVVVCSYSSKILKWSCIIIRSNMGWFPLTRAQKCPGESGVGVGWGHFVVWLNSTKKVNDRASISKVEAKSKSMNFIQQLEVKDVANQNTDTKHRF